MADYAQTHVVPTEGLPAWAGPDGSVTPAANLDPGLDVMVIDVHADWAHIRCSNGWEAWVDNRRLIVSPPAPAAAAPPPPPTPSTQAAPPPPPTQQAPAAANPTQQAPAAPPTQPVPQAAPSGQPGPPSAVWGAPGAAAAAAPGAPRAGGGLSFGPGQIIALVGGLLFLVSSWLPWIEYKFSGAGRTLSESFSAYRIPAHFLLDSQSELGGLSLGIVIAFFGVACIVAALLSALNRSLRVLSLVAGALAFLVVVLFLVQTKFLSDELPSFVERGYFSLLRWGAYLALVGAILALVGGVLALAQKRS
jgi:hypothetical protein